MKRHYDILVDGIVKGERKYDGIYEYFPLGSIVADFRMDALRSTMLLLDISYIELAYVGHYDVNGHYYVCLYHDVHIDSENRLYFEMYTNIYLSDIAYERIS